MFLSASSSVFSSSTRIATFLHNLPHDNCQKQLHKLINSYNMNRWVCYKGVGWWFYICNEPLGVPIQSCWKTCLYRDNRIILQRPTPIEWIKTCQIQVFPLWNLQVDSKFLLAADFAAQLLFVLQPWSYILNAASAPMIPFLSP